MVEIIDPGEKNYTNEVIRQRSLTMEDGRERSLDKLSKEEIKIEPAPSGPDDGDTLG